MAQLFSRAVRERQRVSAAATAADGSPVALSSLAAATAAGKAARSAKPFEEGAVDFAASSSSSGAVAQRSFKALGLRQWLCDTCTAMGYRLPTPVQHACIPAALSGKDVMGFAETGSGKTAAYALPILQALSADAWAPFALVMAPTRELALQIEESFAALGAQLGGGGSGLRTCLAIGGMNMIDQSLQLGAGSGSHGAAVNSSASGAGAARPHVIIATPGRLRAHLEGPAPPDLSRVRFLVLDEADSLLSLGFEDDIAAILRHLSPGTPPATVDAAVAIPGLQRPRRQTFLFSATHTPALEALKRLAMHDAIRFDLVSEASTRLPADLQQEYLFMPENVKTCYLVAALHELVDVQTFTARQKRFAVGGGAGDQVGLAGHGNAAPSRGALSAAGAIGARLAQSILKQKRREQISELQQLTGSRVRSREAEDVNDLAVGDDDPSTAGAPVKARSAIVFVNKCADCQEVSETLLRLDIDNVTIHGLLTQEQRIQALSLFKSHLCTLLICTDVASRSLDIPHVDLVVNYDLPRSPKDYVHRVGRTARAGRSGHALSLISQYDVDLTHAIEEHIEKKLVKCERVKDTDCLRIISTVSTAARVARQSLIRTGFVERAEEFALQRKEAREKMRARHREHVRGAEDAPAAGHRDTEPKKRKDPRAGGGTVTSTAPSSAAGSDATAARKKKRGGSSGGNA